MKLHVENESIGATYIAMAFAALSLMSLSVHADQLFVSDKLVISVYTEANQDSDKLTTIDSGDAVEALEKAEGYTHIRLADGREGWVPAELLSNEGAETTVLQDYSARELAVRPGEEVIVEESRHEWLLVRNALGECGWIPAANTEPL